MRRAMSSSPERKDGTDDGLTVPLHEARVVTRKSDPPSTSGPVRVRFAASAGTSLASGRPPGTPWAPSTTKEGTITSQFGAGAAALVAWFAVHLVVLWLWRPPRSAMGVTTPLTDESLLRVLRAVARHGSGEPLRRDLFAAALGGLVRRRRVELEDRGADGVWLLAGSRADDGPMGPHELAMLERIRAASTRFAGPVPLDALRLSDDDTDRAWSRRSADAALGWGRSAGLLRDHVPAPARAIVRTLLAVPVALVTHSVVAARELTGAVPMLLVWALAAAAWWTLGRALVDPLTTPVLTEAGRVVLATAPLPHEEVPAWIASVLVTPLGQEPLWSPTGRSWRLADVDRTGVRGGGERPGVAFYGAFLTGVLIVVGGLFLGIVTVSVLSGVGRAWPAEVGLVAVWLVWALGLGRTVRTAALAVADLREGPEQVVGHVVERRQVSVGDDPDRYYLALDDGTGVVTTFVVTREQFAAAPEGGWVRVSITPRLDHIAGVELLTPTASSSAVADMALSRRRRSRARSGG